MELTNIKLSPYAFFAGGFIILLVSVFLIAFSIRIYAKKQNGIRFILINFLILFAIITLVSSIAMFIVGAVLMGYDKGKTYFDSELERIIEEVKRQVREEVERQNSGLRVSLQR